MEVFQVLSVIYIVVCVIVLIRMAIIHSDEKRVRDMFMMWYKKGYYGDITVVEQGTQHDENDELIKKEFMRRYKEGRYEDVLVTQGKALSDEAHDIKASENAQENIDEATEVADVNELKIVQQASVDASDTPDSVKKA